MRVWHRAFPLPMQVSRQQELAHLFSVFFLTTAQLFSALSFKILVAF